MKIDISLEEIKTVGVVMVELAMAMNAPNKKKKCRNCGCFVDVK